MSLPISQQISGLDAVRSLVLTLAPKKTSGVRPAEISRHMEVLSSIEKTLEWVATHKPLIEEILRERKGQANG